MCVRACISGIYGNINRLLIQLLNMMGNRGDNVREIEGVCVNVCMYIRTYVRTYVRMYVCTVKEMRWQRGICVLQNSRKNLKFKYVSVGSMEICTESFLLTSSKIVHLFFVKVPSKLKVYISYKLENDLPLANNIVGQNNLIRIHMINACTYI